VELQRAARRDIRDRDLLVAAQEACRGQTGRRRVEEAPIEIDREQWLARLVPFGVVRAGEIAPRLPVRPDETAADGFAAARVAAELVVGIFDVGQRRAVLELGAAQPVTDADRIERLAPV